MKSLDQCITGWPGREDKDGYPIARVGGKYRTAAKLIYEIFVGPIPDGMCMRHSCDNRKCLNPLHLVAGTHADNMADKRERGRQPRGEKSAAAKYDDKTAYQIRSGCYSASTARALWGISKSQFYRIRNSEAGSARK